MANKKTSTRNYHLVLIMLVPFSFLAITIIVVCCLSGKGDVKALHPTLKEYVSLTQMDKDITSKAQVIEAPSETKPSSPKDLIPKEGELLPKDLTPTSEPVHPKIDKGVVQEDLAEEEKQESHVYTDQMRTIDGIMTPDTSQSQLWNKFKESFSQSLKPDASALPAGIPAFNSADDLKGLDYSKYKDAVAIIASNAKEACNTISGLLHENVRKEALFEAIALFQVDLLQFYDSYTIGFFDELHSKFIEFVLPEESNIPKTKKELSNAIYKLKDGKTDSDALLAQAFSQGLVWLDVLELTDKLIQTFFSGKQQFEDVSKLMEHTENIKQCKTDILCTGLYKPEEIYKVAEENIALINKALGSKTDHLIKRISKTEEDIIQAFKNIESCRNVVLGLTFNFLTRKFDMGKIAGWCKLLNSLNSIKVTLMANASAYKTQCLRAINEIKNGKIEKVLLDEKFILHCNKDLTATDSILMVIKDIETGKLKELWDPINKSEGDIYKLIELSFKTFDLSSEIGYFLPEFTALYTKYLTEDTTGAVGFAARRAPKLLSEQKALNPLEKSLFDMMEYKSAFYKANSTCKTILQNTSAEFLSFLAEDVLSPDLARLIQTLENPKLTKEQIPGILEDIKKDLKAIENKTLNANLSAWGRNLQFDNFTEFLKSSQDQLEMFDNYIQATKVVPKVERKLRGACRKAEKYKFTEEVRKDVVYLAGTQTSSGVFVLKIQNAFSSEEGIPGIIAACLFDHPNIEKLVDYFHSGDKATGVFNYFCGHSLKDEISYGKFLTEDIARGVFRKIVSAVDYMHCNGVAHRDIKDDNILVDDNNNILLIDLKTCTFQDGFFNSMTSAGSREYYSPESVKRASHDPKMDDVWSLGVLLYQMTTGYFPFDGEDIIVLSHNILSGVYTFPKKLSDELTDLISRILVPEDKRISIREITESAWFKNHSEEYNNYVIERDIHYSVDQSRKELLEGVLKFDKTYKHDDSAFKENPDKSKVSTYIAMRKPQVLMYFLLEDKLSKSSTPITPLNLKSKQDSTSNKFQTLETFVKILNGEKESENKE